MSEKLKINRYLYVFIDGYNVIHNWKTLKTCAQTDLEEARERLVEQMVNYSSLTGERVCIVFDAYGSTKREETKEKHGPVSVVFTGRGQTADSYIESEIKALSKDPKNLVKVVTSDWAEQQIAMGSGAMRVSVREFHEDVKKVRKIISDDYLSKTRRRNPLEERLNKEVLEKLERWRKKPH